jgi:hypothetical protein
MGGKFNRQDAKAQNILQGQLSWDSRQSTLEVFNLAACFISNALGVLKINLKNHINNQPD